MHATSVLLWDIYGIAHRSLLLREAAGNMGAHFVHSSPTKGIQLRTHVNSVVLS